MVVVVEEAEADGLLGIGAMLAVETLEPVPGAEGVVGDPVLEGGLEVGVTPGAPFVELLLPEKDCIPELVDPAVDELLGMAGGVSELWGPTEP